MQVRLVRSEELSVVGELTVAAYEPFTLGPSDPYVARLRDAASRAREGELWVAVDESGLLGSVTYCPPGSPLRELAREDQGELRMLSVAPAARGRGVGRALVALCHGRAADHGARSMVLSSLPEMRAAHRLYTRLGYRRVPALDWTPAPDVRLIAFGKELP